MTSFQPKLAFVSASSKQAREARRALEKLYPSVPLKEADIIVALGGDGFLLHLLKSNMSLQIPVYGMNLGTVGFLMNPYHVKSLYERLEKALSVKLHPLKMTVLTQQGKYETALALNEVSLLRQTHQAAKIKIVIDQVVRLPELVCDGVLLSTPAGSTAYNLSAHGPILPLNSELLALTPICPFRPRRWRGALLPFISRVQFKILEAEKRSVSAVADSIEVRNVTEVEIYLEKSIASTLLFDSGHALDERILREQFSV